MSLLFLPQPNGDVMATFQVFKETALPALLTPNSVIYVAPPDKPGYMECYVVGKDGETTRSTMTDARVQGMIDAAIAGSSGGLLVVDTIAARDALTPEGALEVLVVDASADATVTAGWARYVWMLSSSSWLKLAEGESQDLVLSWANLTGKPTSSASQIDAAVGDRHTHTNKTQLDKIGQDAEGNLTYNGARPLTVWSSDAW